MLKNQIIAFGKMQRQAEAIVNMIYKGFCWVLGIFVATHAEAN